MLQSYDSKMKQALARRDLAQARLRLASDECTAAINAKIDGIKCEFNQKIDNVSSRVSDFSSNLAPENIVKNHPWGSAAGVAGFGLLLAPLLKNLFRRPRRRSIAAQPPQRVVIEVVGAHEPAPKKMQRGSGWGPILDAVMHGIPAVAAFAQQHLAANDKHNGNGHASAPAGLTEEEESVSPVPNPPQQHPSISRRTAPPPP